MSETEIIFHFDGKPVTARSDDTVASALYRAGRRVFSRSFKYHRPRGLLCASGKCPNCMMNVDGVPNLRSCTVPVRAGMVVKHQNAWPSLERDWLSMTQELDFLMPVGWYYKILTTRTSWHAAEPFIRKVAGLGEAPPPDAPGGEYEHAYMRADAAIVGGGPAGLDAALQAADQGEQVVLIDDQPALGGHLRYRGAKGDLEQTISRIQSHPRVKLLSGCYCFGLYEGNLLGVVQPRPHGKILAKLIHLRARRVVIATGAYEAPLLFENNDLPGVMLSSAAQRLMRIHGIRPGERAVIVGREILEVREDLERAGVKVVSTVEPDEVIAATGSQKVTGLNTRKGKIACDLVVVCGPRVPDAGLLHQAGARLEWAQERGAFVPVDMPHHVSAAGEVLGETLRPVLHLPAETSKRQFVCFCEDVTSQDFTDAVGEGFDHIETLKRYTTTTMGPCQGRMCQLTSIGVCSRLTGRTMEETGVTTSRPPNPSVSLGALAGARHHPVRRTPMHSEHEAHGAVWLDMGDWKRPRFYANGTLREERECVRQEYDAVRERAGIIDVSTLGKLDVKGRDAGKLLDKVYTNRFSDLNRGRVRYSVICDEAGIIMDDGTISRLADDHFFITTTTGNLEFVEQWLFWWTVGTGWDVHITNMTAGLASVNVAGPKSRDVLRKLTSCDLENKAFPYMSCREAEVAGAQALLLRIGFVGETGWEMHFPADMGGHLWRAVIEAGKEFDIRPFGVEAQRLLRLEKRHVIVGVDTDALTSPFEADMAWVARLDKDDFVGKAALARAAERSSREKLVGFLVRDNAVPDDGSPVLIGGKLAGRVTSARYSPLNQAAIGLAWIPVEQAAEGTEIELRANGQAVRGIVKLSAFYDPEGARLRQ